MLWQKFILTVTTCRHSAAWPRNLVNKYFPGSRDSSKQQTRPQNRLLITKPQDNAVPVVTIIQVSQLQNSCINQNLVQLTPSTA
jgi:hypothetical protein